MTDGVGGRRIRAACARAAAALLAAAAILLLGAPVASAALTPAEPLGHSGRWITDAYGRVVILHGTNVIEKHRPSRDPAERVFKRKDADLLEQHGFNVVRLGFQYSNVEPEPGGYTDQHFSDLEVTQKRLADRGIFTLLDFHQDLYADLYGGNGFPDWSAQGDGLPHVDAGFPGTYFTSPAMNRAFDNFWANAPGPDAVGLQDHYAEAMRRWAAYFKEKPLILGYDMLNEPWPGSLWSSCANPAGCPPGGFDQTLLTDFTRKMADALRAVDPEHMVWYEPNLQFDIGAATGHGDPGDDNAGFGFHNYCLGEVGSHGGTAPRFPDEFGGCETGEQTVFDNAEAQSDRFGDALLMTEWGAIDDAGITRRVADGADANMLGWAHWAYGLLESQLDALVRPYPRLVAGTPESWSFDADSLRFKASWTTSLPDGGDARAMESELFVPELHYGNDYAITVSGGEVIGGAGTQYLIARACPGDSTVSVTVRDTDGELPLTCPEQPTEPGGGGGPSGDPGGPDDPGDPGGKPSSCPAGNSPTVRCARTTLADGTRVLQVVGTTADETLVGSKGRDIIVCGSGDDRARARAGADIIRCGAGDDRVSAGRGADQVFAGSGKDRGRGGKGGDRLEGNQGDDVVVGGRGGDLVIGGGGDDRVAGGAGPDTVRGGRGRDTTRGQGGDDLVSGGADPDLVRGGAGNDRHRTADKDRDRIGCGSGLDAVRADRRDRMRRSCERVRRVA